LETLISQLQEHINYVILSFFIVLLALLKDVLIKICKKIKLNKELDIEKITQKDTFINEILSEIRIKSDAARCYILKFHNGDYYSNGTPIVKFSMTHESCSLGISHYVDHTQNYLLSSYSGINDLLKSNKDIIITSKMKECNFKGYLQEKNTLALFSFPIRSHKNSGNVIAIFCIEWCSPSKINNINKNSIIEIKEKYAGILQNLVNKHQ
jgi:hypothetical protein